MKERVEVVIGWECGTLKPEINKFLEMTNGKLIDIKFSTFRDTENNHYLRALIIYVPSKDDDDE